MRSTALSLALAAMIPLAAHADDDPAPSAAEVLALIEGIPEPEAAAWRPLVDGRAVYLRNWLSRDDSESGLRLMAEEARRIAAFAAAPAGGGAFVVGYEAPPDPPHEWPGHYLVQLPEGWGEWEPEGGWPMIVFLHGAGERGLDPSALLRTGLPRHVAEGLYPDFVVVSPQCPATRFWSLEQLDAMLEDARRRLAPHPGHLVLTGLSMGGFGTWDWAIARTELFACIAPICGGGDAFSVPRLAATPTWAFHAADDSVVHVFHSDRMVEALRRAGGDVRYTRYPDGGHDSWTRAYTDPGLAGFFRAHTRPPSAIPPEPREAIDASGDPAKMRIVRIPRRRVAFAETGLADDYIHRAINRLEEAAFGAGNRPQPLSARDPIEIRSIEARNGQRVVRAALVLDEGANPPGTVEEPTASAAAVFFEGTPEEAVEVLAALEAEARARGHEPSGDRRLVVLHAPLFSGTMLFEAQVLLEGD